jgi:hypothetical protein
LISKEISREDAQWTGALGPHGRIVRPGRNGSSAGYPLVDALRSPGLNTRRPRAHVLCCNRALARLDRWPARLSRRRHQCPETNGRWRFCARSTSSGPTWAGKYLEQGANLDEYQQRREYIAGSVGARCPDPRRPALLALFGRSRGALTLRQPAPTGSSAVEIGVVTKLARNFLTCPDEN